MNNAINHKCSKCDSVLKFNPKTQSWKCECCTTDLEELNPNKKDTNIEFDVYKCKNCGAEVIADENTSVTSCIYCQNTTLLKSKLEGIFNPDYLIPFNTTKEDAITELKKLSKGKWLMPKEFNIKRSIEHIKGIYLPYWMYSFDSNGIVNFECNKVTTWISGVYKYIKTDKYETMRGGNIFFEKILVSGSENLQNNIIDSIEPFDYDELKKFKYSYLSGFLLEKSDVKEKELINVANNKAKDCFIKIMKKDVTGYNEITEVNNNINLYNEKSSCVLFPVWLLNIKYKNKIYTFAINGQTGKMIGDIPLDIKKAIILWISLYLIIFTLLLLINYIMVIL